MIIFFYACHIDMWDMVENDIFFPKIGNQDDLSRASWNEYKNIRYKLNSKAKFFSHEIWDILGLAYEVHPKLKDKGRVSSFLSKIKKHRKDHHLKPSKRKNAFEDDTLDEDDLSFIFRKIHIVQNKKCGSRWKNYMKKNLKETKEKNQVIYHKCNKLGHFMYEFITPAKEKK
ncbi:hypothetical protein CR513_16396, partial [Mucuna pruriens]